MILDGLHLFVVLSLNISVLSVKTLCWLVSIYYILLNDWSLQYSQRQKSDLRGINRPIKHLNVVNVQRPEPEL